VYRHGIPTVPITLKVAGVDTGRFGVLKYPHRVKFAAFHTNGEEIHFSNKAIYPIHVEIDEQTLNRKFFGDLLSDTELTGLLTKYYEREVTKRTFSLHPYFTDENFRYWFVDVEAHRKMAGLKCDSRYGVVDWTELYPKGTDERMEIHQLINRLGRKRQRERRFNPSLNRQRTGYRHSRGLYQANHRFVSEHLEGHPVHRGVFLFMSPALGEFGCPI